MEITREQKTQVEQIISEMECPKDFMCYDSGFKNVSKIRMIADGEKVECLEENRLRCKFALHYGSFTICECPLRNYIARSFQL
jgi:hypothetical protein